jgi:hypothetical protein
MTEDTPTKVVVDCSTGETQILPLTAEEIAQREADAIAYEAEQTARAEAQAALDALKASAKAKLVAGEPLTAEEADTLVL